MERQKPSGIPDTIFRIVGNSMLFLSRMRCRGDRWGLSEMGGSDCRGGSAMIVVNCSSGDVDGIGIGILIVSLFFEQSGYLWDGGGGVGMLGILLVVGVGCELSGIV